MKIILSHDFLKKFNQESFKSLINIIKVTNNSTLISIKGHKLEIPFILKNNIKYTAEIKDNKLYINEIVNKVIINSEKSKKNQLINNISEFLDKLFDFENKTKFNENEIKYLLFNELYSKINNEEIKNKKIKQYFFTNNKVDEYYFIFNLPYYNSYTRIFLKIDKNKNVFINMYSENFIKEKNKNFINDIKEALKNIAKSFIVNFFENKDDFFKNIIDTIDTKKIDIEI